MTVIITKNGKNAEKISESKFADEDNLQNFIHENPDCVPLYELDEDIRLLILAREVPTQSGPIDAIGTDANGEVYIIETKLYKNPDKRLVIAQVLDYGASISENVDNELLFFQTIEKKVNSHFQMSISEKLTDFYDITAEDSNEIIESFKENLEEGNFRFVVLMDHLEKRLKDLIAFINRNSRFDLYGVELEHYKYETFEITIPKLFGSEIKKEIAKKAGFSRRRTWNESSFFEEVNSKLNDNDANTIKSLFNYLSENSDQIRWGTGSIKGSFNPIFLKVGPKSMLSIFTDGTLQLNYAWFIDNEQQNIFREQFRKSFGQILNIPPEDGHSRYPTFPISEWGKLSRDIIIRISALLKDF